MGHLADAITWTLTCNGTWAEVAAHLGVSEALVRQRTAAEGMTMPRKITVRETELLEPARARVAEAGTLWRSDHRG